MIGEAAPNPAAQSSSAASLRPVALVTLAVLLLRAAYLIWFCGYDLIEDEAQYWLWSKHLAWSYSTKGPGVAWAIWLSSEFLGEKEWMVRLPSALFAALGALAAGTLVRDLAVDAHRRRGWTEDGTAWASPARAGMLAALAYSIVPVLAGAGMLMTIDSPYVACWAVACWAFNRALRDAEPAGAAAMTDEHSEGREEAAWRGCAWFLVGLAVAIGFLFKYTMLLLLPGLIGYLLVTRRDRSALLPTRAMRVWFTAGCALAIAGVVPVLYWNQQNGWPTVAHLLGHLGLKGGDVPVSPQSHWSPTWLPELIGQQIGMVGPWIVLGCAAAWRAMRGQCRVQGAECRVGEESRAGKLLLAWAALPILVFYAIVALIAEPEGNWPMAAYATLVPLAAWAGADAVVARRRGDFQNGRRSRVLLWRTGIWYAVIAAVFIHKLDWVADAAVSLNHQAWFRSTFHSLAGRDPEDRDLAGRVRGAKEMAGHVQELVRNLENEKGVEAFVVAQHYGRASQLSYYLRPRIAPGVPRVSADGERFGPARSRVERPVVLCAMKQTGGRPTQFDLWPDTNLEQDWLMGRPAVIVTSLRPEVVRVWEKMFERVEPIPGGKLRGEAKADRSALLGYGYRGLRAPGNTGAAGGSIFLPATSTEAQ